MKTRLRQCGWAILVLGVLVLLGSSSCSGTPGESPVRPATDRPTFVWIFSDP